MENTSDKKPELKVQTEVQKPEVKNVKSPTMAKKGKIKINSDDRSRTMSSKPNIGSKTAEKKEPVKKPVEPSPQSGRKTPVSNTRSKTVLDKKAKVE